MHSVASRTTGMLQKHRSKRQDVLFYLFFFFPAEKYTKSMPYQSFISSGIKQAPNNLASMYGSPCAHSPARIYSPQ